MKILVTGANGFTGRHFARLAQDSGHEVVKLQANLTEAEALTSEVREINPTHVVHLAALSFIGHENPRIYYDVNFFGTVNLLDALNALPIPPVLTLLASSANVYGSCRESPITENQLPDPTNHYSVAKLAMEHASGLYSRLPTVIARPFNYTGRGQSQRFVIPKLVDHFRREEPAIRLGDVGVEREFNDVRFVSRAYLHLLLHGQGGTTYNVCSGLPYTLSHVMDVLREITGHRIEVELDPAFVRVNEVPSLCGNPERLQSLLRSRGILLPNPPLTDTLEWMLSAPHDQAPPGKG